MIRKLLVVLCAVAVTVGLAGATPAATAQQAAAQPRAKAVFNDPNAGWSEKVKIFTHLQHLIEGAEKNSKIRIAMYKWESGKPVSGIVKALIEAHASRNVTVQVLVDKKSTVDDSAAVYRTLRENLTGGDSWVRYCGDKDGEGDDQVADEHACIGSHEVESSMHNKFFLFTRTWGNSWVVSNGTSNMTPGMRKMWNSHYTVSGDHHLYVRYLRYFKDLRAQNEDVEYYKEPSPKTNTSYYLPISTELTDPFEGALKKITCPNTRIRIGMWAITRTEIATELHRMAAKGCEVEIIANRIDRPACETLTEGALDTMDIRTFVTDEQHWGIHQKNMIIDGNYLAPHNEAVFTGSANLDYPSIHKGDENIVRVLGQPGIYDRFSDKFEHMQSLATVPVVKAANCAEVEPPTARR